MPRAGAFYLIAFAMLLPSAGALRRVVVTGGNKGIGQAICKRILCDQADTHVLLGSRNAARGEKAVQQILADPAAPSDAADRIEVLPLETTDDASVAAAVKLVADKYGSEPAPLHGICCNAGVGFGRSISETLDVNLYGVKRCCEAFLPLINPDGGRIVNIASASGPNFVRGLDGEQEELFTSPKTTWEELDAALKRYAALTDYEGISYGLSKAALTQYAAHPSPHATPPCPPAPHPPPPPPPARPAPPLPPPRPPPHRRYTMQLAQQQPSLKVNACSPGYVLTDLTAGMGASKTPDESNCHVAPLFLLFDEPPTPPATAWYYGSDAVRSPLNVYRGPGDPPYTGP